MPKTKTVQIDVVRHSPASNVESGDDLPEVVYSVKCSVYPAEPMTYWDPGCDAEVAADFPLSEDEQLEAFELAGESRYE